MKTEIAKTFNLVELLLKFEGVISLMIQLVLTQKKISSWINQYFLCKRKQTINLIKRNYIETFCTLKYFFQKELKCWILEKYRKKKLLQYIYQINIDNCLSKLKLKNYIIQWFNFQIIYQQQNGFEKTEFPINISRDNQPFNRWNDSIYEQLYLKQWELRKRGFLYYNLRNFFQYQVNDHFYLNGFN
ncbi:unnamed protein product [Paramecium sonneborni]|uniref:Uncharacterized protein n=1 Tax=Paramecium sonneborni TaxID=65129 RepID=A0A8S1RMB4_9CILI|nr:unnamed protein product [Paramecium sonneborni]